MSALVSRTAAHRVASTLPTRDDPSRASLNAGPHGQVLCLAPPERTEGSNRGHVDVFIEDHS